MTKKDNELLLKLFEEVKETKTILYQLESQVNDLRQANAVTLFVDVLVQKGFTKTHALSKAREVGLYGDANIPTSVVK
jgi:hypothetical protein